MTAIQISNVGKTFILPHERRDTLKENVIQFLQKRAHENFHALCDISFEVRQGDFLGIVGKNGSGKSTLLKIIAGIYRPTKGVVQVQGRIAPFLELGIGFQSELTARENIVVNATLLGMNRKQIREKFKKIIEFAELDYFVDVKIKNFSSGMRARLAFAIAKEADADIYLCDEVLAVGDEGFQRKCLAVFKAWKDAGKTVVLVSHNASQIVDICNRAILLDQGLLVAEGEAANIVQQYHERIRV